VASLLLLDLGDVLTLPGLVEVVEKFFCSATPGTEAP
jgi:hypothetical protein